MEMGFRTILLLAKDNDNIALSELIAMYRPLIIKLSIIDGTFDEDLRQELMTTLVRCVYKIRTF